MTKRAYVPPRPDEPLDAIQEALARALVAILVDELRAEFGNDLTVTDDDPDEALPQPAPHLTTKRDDDAA